MWHTRSRGRCTTDRGRRARTRAPGTLRSRLTARKERQHPSHSPRPTNRESESLERARIHTGQETADKSLSTPGVDGLSAMLSVFCGVTSHEAQSRPKCRREGRRLRPPTTRGRPRATATATATSAASPFSGVLCFGAHRPQQWATAPAQPAKASPIRLTTAAISQAALEGGVLVDGANI